MSTPGDLSPYPSPGVYRGRQPFPADTFFASGPVGARVRSAAFLDFAKEWLLSPAVIPSVLVVAYLVGSHRDRWWEIAFGLVCMALSLGFTYSDSGPRIRKAMALIVEPSGEVTSMFGGAAVSLAPGTFVTRHRRDHLVLVPMAAGSAFRLVVPDSLLSEHAVKLLDRGTPAPWGNSAFLTTGPPRWSPSGRIMSRTSLRQLLVPTFYLAVMWLWSGPSSAVPLIVILGSCGLWDASQAGSLIRSARYLATDTGGEFRFTETDTCRLVTRVGSPWRSRRAAAPFPIDSYSADREKVHQDVLNPAWINPLTRLPIFGSQR